MTTRAETIAVMFTAISQAQCMVYIKMFNIWDQCTKMLMLVITAEWYYMCFYMSQMSMFSLMKLNNAYNKY